MTVDIDTIPIDEGAIELTLAASRNGDPARVRSILDRARALAGLTSAEVGGLMGVADPELVGEIFAAARAVKERIYGTRLVLFAPVKPVAQHRHSQPKDRHDNDFNPNGRQLGIAGRISHQR